MCRVEPDEWKEGSALEIFKVCAHGVAFPYGHCEACNEEAYQKVTAGSHGWTQREMQAILDRPHITEPWKPF